MNLINKNFLNDVWQQKAYLFKDAFAKIGDIVDGSALKDLAGREDCESRIILGSEINGHWHCQHGPFNKPDFVNLADKDWTLLVQGLDQWNECAAQLLNEFSFLPKWRLEDIMASYAPKGGGVGPHFDYYDVFLIQASGSRKWQLGQRCDQSTELQDNDEVKLLAEFNCEHTHQVQVGDMLYIPAGLAHWGTATSDDCITLSVGFRAPSHNEILIRSLDLFAEKLSQQEQSDRYKDSQQSIDSHPNKINKFALQQMRSSAKIGSSELLARMSETAFGQLVTDQRYENLQAPTGCLKKGKIELTLAQGNNLDLVHGINSRFAFTDSQLFVDGEAFEVGEDFSRMICDKVIGRKLNDQEMEILLGLQEFGAILIHSSKRD